MWIRYVFITVIGLSAGFVVSGGVFTVLFTVGLVPRFAGKTRTATHVKIYENAITIGTIFWNTIGLYHISLPFGQWVVGLFGLFSGIFVGCLALAIAEMLNGIPIFYRRINFRRGLGITILCFAIGKSVGNIFYFLNGG